MADSIRVGAHGYVINLKDKDVRSQVGDRYERGFPVSSATGPAP
jgi:hypothetical protein